MTKIVMGMSTGYFLIAVRNKHFFSLQTETTDIFNLYNIFEVFFSPSESHCLVMSEK